MNNGIIKMKGVHYLPVRKLSMSMDSIVNSTIVNAIVPPLVYSPKELKVFSENVMRNFRRSGYSFARMDTMNFDRKNGELSGSINQGTMRYVFLHGNETVPSVVITREFESIQSSPLQSGKLLQTWENLWNTNYFSSLEFIPRYVDSGAVDLLVDVKEQPNQMLRIGARIDNERNTQVGLDLIQEHPFGTDFRVSGRIIGSTRLQSLAFGIDAARLFDSFWSADVRGFSSTTNMYNYTRRSGLPVNEFEYVRQGDWVLQRNGVQALFGRQIERKGKFYTQFRYEFQRFFMSEDTMPHPEFLSLTSLKFATRFDTQDRANLPTNGRVLEMSIESTVLNPPNAVSFSKVEFRYKSTISFGSHSFTPSLHFGFGDKTMPLTEQFSIGGEDSFYGKREDEERGQQVALGSFEYRIQSPVRVFFDTYIAARYDIGSVWANFSTIKFSGLKHGLGFSLTLDTPLGLAKISVGQSIYFIDKPGIVRAPALGYFSIGARL
ncbi:MAG: BamA/TamA family outer membrane protein [Ignavibacteriae bacterium]|nr:BamA/TamA family outer membrane protein [Ignavibacteriota bacterium]